MSFRFEVTGMEAMIAKMQDLPDKGRKVASMALYEGAGVVADSVSAAVHGIATEPFKYAARGQKRKPSPEEKEILLSAKRGVSKFKKKKTSVSTNVGMKSAGYASLKGKTKPIALIANSINSGTSFMEQQPFFAKAAETSAGRAAAVIEGGIKSRIKELSLD